MTATLPDAAYRRPRRLSRADRRDQLLDSAAAVLVEKGVAALTMEGVAAEAGVSKALPYSHFENADEVLTALRDRELDRFSEAAVAAFRSSGTYEERIAAAVHSYFDFIARRGSVLVALLRNLPMTEEEQRLRFNPAFFSPMFERELGLSPALARVTSNIYVVGVSGGIDAWVSGVVDRATAEAATVQAMLGGAAAVAAAERAGTLPIHAAPS